MTGTPAQNGRSRGAGRPQRQASIAHVQILLAGAAPHPGGRRREYWVWEARQDPGGVVWRWRWKALVVKGPRELDVPVKLPLALVPE